MFGKRKYRKEMKVLTDELERASSAFDQVGYDEVIKKIRKIHSGLYRSGRYYDRLSFGMLFFWVIFVLLLVLVYVVYLILR